MLNRNRRIATGLLGLTLAALLALPAAALANTSGPIAQTGGMTVVLPMLGSTLTVDVTLDAVGNITNVDLTPPDAFSATGVSPHAVSFATTGDTTKVSVRAVGSKMSVRTSSTSLDDLLGSGTWSAKLYGSADPTTVDYTVSSDADGKPTLSIGTVFVPAVPSGVTHDTPVVGNSSNDWGSSAWARITFSHDGFTMRLKIRVSLRNEGDRPASLSIQLSGKDRQRTTGSLGDLAGDHTWTGVMCNGSPATLTFTVNKDDGTVMFKSSDPVATVLDPEEFGFGFKHGFDDSEHGFKGSFFIARFDGTHTKVMVWLHPNEDGTYTLVVSARADRCWGTHADNPTVDPTPGPDAKIGDHSSGFGDGHFGFGGFFSGKH